PCVRLRSPVLIAQTDDLDHGRLLDLPGIDGVLERDAVLSARDCGLDGRIHALGRVLLLAALVVQASRPQNGEAILDPHRSVRVPDELARTGPNAVLRD